jgi:putative addiction module killer protein
MAILLATDEYNDWYSSIKDEALKKRVWTRIRRAEDGNFGDVESVGEGVYEMRSEKLGYRLYYFQESKIVYRLLIGGFKGNKNKQTQDIQHARAIKNRLQEAKP